MEFVDRNFKTSVLSVEAIWTLFLVTFNLYAPLQGETIPAENIALLETLIEPWFIFALIWSVGGTCDGDGRKKFSEYLRKKMDEEKVSYTENS